MPPTYQQKKALKKLKVRLFRTDMRTFGYRRIKKEFSTQKGNRIVKARLIRCIIYQAATWMQRGKVPKVEGNLRSLYYQWVKPVFSKIPGGLEGKFDPYLEMLDVMELFIAKMKLFKYRDLDLIDPSWENRWYSDGRNPHILVYAEKDGFIRVLQEVNEKYGVTTVALGGYPSHMSSEYLIEQMNKKIGELEPLILLNIVDYDPSGHSIQKSFQKQLQNQGVEIKDSIPLILPKHYTTEQIRIFKFPIPSEYPKRVENWMKQTNGIRGKPWGLEADSMAKSQLRPLLHEKIAPFLRDK